MSLFNNSNTSWIFGFASLGTPPPSPIITDGMRRWQEPLLNLLVLMFSSLGVVTNAINIRVFIKQGLSSDSSTIGLFSLAIADFMGCLFEIPGSLCAWFGVAGTQGLYVSCLSLITLVAHAPHVCMSRITCWITVYIAVERCLCVLIPFKVKRLIRPKVTATAMALIYFVIMGAYSPYYAFTKPIFIFHSGLNETVILLKGEKQERTVIYFQSLIFNTILSSAAIVIIAIATFLLMYKLFASRKWRQSTANMKGQATSTKADDPNVQKESRMKARELEVLKTVTMVTGLFLFCLSMSHIPGLTIAILPDVSVLGFNKNLFFVAYYYKTAFDVINSSLNFFFYVRTSSRYKTAFNEVFRRKKLDSAKS